MKDHSECKRQFIHVGRAWYGKASLMFGPVDEIHIGMHHPEGSTTGEFSIEWIELGDGITPHLKAFDDSWSALWEFRDLLENLAQLDDTNPTPERICRLLVELGIEDVTPEKQEAS